MDIVDDDKDYDDKEENVDEEDANDELSSEEIDLPIYLPNGLLIDLPMQQCARNLAALELTDTDTKRPLRILNVISGVNKKQSWFRTSLYFNLLSILSNTLLYR